MAYIFQHRRDTLANWNSVNPVLADAEIGYILDLDDQGRQKSSLYKIGDGRTAWKDLPLFGFGGNVHDDFDGSDLNITVPSRQAVLNKISEVVNSTRNDIVNGTVDVEGLLNKLSTSQLVQFISPEGGEEFNGKVNTIEVPLAWEDVEPVMRNQIVSRFALLEQLQGIWNDFGGMEDRQTLIENTHKEFVNNTFNPFVTTTESQIKTLQDFATVFGEFKTSTESTLSEHATILEDHEKTIKGWDEEKETGVDEETGEPIIETIRHKGFDEKLDDVQTKCDESVAAVDKKLEDFKTEINSKHNILSEVDFAKIKDFESYAEGTLFYTYAAQS
jgi:hypothetical protein